MLRLLLTLCFIVPTAYWLRFESRRTASLTKAWRWVAAALVLQAVAGILSSTLHDQFLANVLLHFIGGGITSCLLFFYLLKTFEIQLNWRLQLAALFMFVSALGTLNELMEYAFELMHLGIYSVDSHDTWRDLVNNSAGAITTWCVLRLYWRSKRQPGGGVKSASHGR